MFIRSSLLIGLLFAGALVLPPPATAQSIMAEPSVQPLSRQRAPGVPMAPRPSSIDPSIVARERAADPAREDRRRQAQVAPWAERDLPMPRPVPSIIAP